MLQDAEMFAYLKHTRLLHCDLLESITLPVSKKFSNVSEAISVRWEKGEGEGEQNEVRLR